MSNVIIIGAGGHGRVIADIVIKSQDRLIGFLDDLNSFQDEILGYPLLGEVCSFNKYKCEDVKFIVGIGSNMERRLTSNQFCDVNWYTAVHPSAQLAVNSEIGEGTAIMANSVINPCARIGRHCIINTGSIVEHDNILGDYVHISPNAVLGGNVNVGELTHIGIGATIKNNISITHNVVIGAGAVVIKDISEEGTYAGVPARRLKR